MTALVLLGGGAAALATVFRNGRRRAAINEALHELRRPLQALALVGPPAGLPGSEAVAGSVRLAAAALERLDREVNGGPLRRPSPRRVRFESVLRAAVGRWRPRVAIEGGSLELRWRAGEAAVEGDREALESALDNLIVNAIEHGGSPIVVEGRRVGRRLRIAVTDAGRAPAAARRRRLRDRRRGHGLAVVRRVASDHGGSFVLVRGARGATAVLDLPLHDRRGRRGA